MITTTLVANGANVYIIGPQHTLESMKKYVTITGLLQWPAGLNTVYGFALCRIANTYNDAAEKTPRKGRIMPLVADVREKVR